MTNKPSYLVTKLLITAMVSACISAPSYAKIYRTVDADGNVTFSDQAPRPPASRPENSKGSTPNSPVVAEEIEVAAPNTFEDSTPYQPWEGNNTADTSESDAAVSYSLSILTPTYDQNIRENAGNIVIRTNIDPELADGHFLRLELDGSLTPDQVVGGAINLTNVPRGTHRARLVVEDGRGRRLAESPESVFHLQRISLLSPANQARNAVGN